LLERRRACCGLRFVPVKDSMIEYFPRIISDDSA
jgi:hypothetical protein